MSLEILTQFVPFLATDCSNHHGKPKLNTARVLELVITAAALIYAMNISMAKLETKVTNIEAQVTQLNTQFVAHLDKGR